MVVALGCPVPVDVTGNDLNAPGSFLWLTIILPPTGTGEITPELVTWLSSIKNKNLNGCGKFTLVGDMPTDTVKVDLSNMDSLEGSLDYFANCKAITSFNVNGKELTGNCYHNRTTQKLKLKSARS